MHENIDVTLVFIKHNNPTGSHKSGSESQSRSSIDKDPQFAARVWAEKYTRSVKGISNFLSHDLNKKITDTPDRNIHFSAPIPDRKGIICQYTPDPVPDERLRIFLKLLSSYLPVLAREKLTYQ